MLSRLGITIYFRTTVGDNPERLKETLTTGLLARRLVITIGGLGPTQDDLTKEMVAEVLGDDVSRRRSPSGVAARTDALRGVADLSPIVSGSRRWFPTQGRGHAQPEWNGAGGVV